MHPGEQLRQWIKESGYRSRHVAKLLNVSYDALVRWMGGRAPLPVYRAKIEEMTGIPADAWGKK